MTASDPIAPLMAALPLPAMLIGPGEQVLGLNDGAKALFREGLEGRNYITAIRHPAVLDAVDATLRDRQNRRARMLTRTAGQDMTYEVQSAWLGLAGAEGVLLSFMDVTHVEQAGQMRRDFVANVSHELRTPLTALLGFIETLRGPAREDAAARDRFLGIMAAEAQRMERLVADLLSLNRVESEERMRPTERVDLAALASSVLRRLAPIAESAGVALSGDFAPAPLDVPGDEDQLRQVITNLVENAIKYGGSGGQVTVRLSGEEQIPALRGPGVEITVIDNGPGIDPIHLPRLTERFYRVDDHRSRDMGGTGLGLAIVKHIVNRHRGRLRVDSDLGQGARFSILLPAEPGVAPVPGATP